MAEFKLTRSAVRDLSEIWSYTFDKWSEYKADKYYAALVTECKMIAMNHDLGKNYQGIIKSLFGRKIKRHIIFYRIIDENLIEVTRILHERMDLKRQIKQ